MKDYHGILDIPVNATQEEIKHQYRQLVRIYHPDRFTNPIDKVYAEEKLKEINEAYSALYNQKTEPSPEVNTSDGPPKPVLEPLWLDFGLVNANEAAVRSFQVNNLGGPAKSIEFIYPDQQRWFQIGNGRPVTQGAPLPVVFDVTADVRKLAPTQVHHTWVEVDMDGARTRLNITVRVATTQSAFKLSSRLALSLAFCVMVLVAVLIFQFSAGVPVISNALHSSEDASFAKRLQVDHLLFSVTESNQPTIYFAQFDGANQISLGIQGWSPAVAPNGRQLAYLADVKDTSQIFVSDVDGRHLRQVTASPEPKTLPIWSPDGRMIAFIIGTEEQAILRVFDIQGNQFYDLPNANLGAVQHFAWSPDSRTLLFDARQGNSSKIYRSNPTGQDIQVFTTLESWDPAWSPDGKRVVVASQQGLYLLDNQGRSLHLLTKQQAFSPSWSFDGTQIAFLSAENAAGKKPDLWVMDAGGHNQMRLTESGIQHFSWSPSSMRLAYITGNSQDQNPILYLWVTDLKKQAQLVAEVNKAYIAWTR